MAITMLTSAIDRVHTNALSQHTKRCTVMESRLIVGVDQKYKLVTRDVKPENTIIGFPGTHTTIGGPELAIIAGPSAVESRDQTFAIAERVYRTGAQFFRGGAYKPRTSPYSFQGLGLQGLKILAEVRDRFGLLIVSEAVDSESLDQVEEYTDVIQIGARNMHNYSLLKHAGRASKPILLKRGMSATLEEFLFAAEYVLSEGNPNVILCERGVRTFADHTRNTLDLSIVPAVQQLSHLPIVVDPSHGTGHRNKVIPLSRAALAVGCDGLMVEVHGEPDSALSDGAQSLDPGEFDQLISEVRQIAGLLQRQLVIPPDPSVVKNRTELALALAAELAPYYLKVEGP
jgi:3-deoxy-7-phosphoheptulonate synthase